MAASANPAAGNNGGQEGTNNANGTTNNGVSVPDNSVIGSNQGELIHSRGLSVEWTPDEQSLLEELLAKYATDKPIHRFARIAMQLKDKCVRDIALRCRWMSKKENGKRRKDDQVSRKNKDKKEKITDSMPKSTHVANRTNGPPYAQAVMSVDSDDGISYQAIGGPAGQLLEQNAQALDQISANFAIFKCAHPGNIILHILLCLLPGDESAILLVIKLHIQENINLFCQARNNILSILNDLNDAPEIMRQMPPLPVKLNDELANSMLQQPPLPK